MRISIDFENCTELWWMAVTIAWQKGSHPPVDQEAIKLIEKLLFGKCPQPWHDCIYLSQDTSAIFEEWCHQFEGWDNGPDYAPTPLDFSSSDVDSEHLCGAENPTKCQEEQYYHWCSTEFGVHSDLVRKVLG